ncbi:MAG: radical SAM protein [Acidobacteriota bacterium]|nr:radical SAM protein [Acidobacteriota bacterium]
MNPHSRCNCRCLMCDIWKRDSVQEISREQFDRQLESIERLGVEWVVFSGGEPLMHSGLFYFCSELRRRNIRVTLLSSGLLLARHAHDICEFADDVIVSLDGPREIHNAIRRVANAFGLLAEGVDKIRSIRSSFPITARCTVQMRNCTQLTAAVASARSLGLNSISFLAVDVHSTAFNHAALPVLGAGDPVALDAHAIECLDGQIETLIAAGECGQFVRETPAKLRAIARHFRCCLGAAERVSPVCNAPWTSAVIEADGSVRPCFFHPASGSLSATQDLYQLINGAEATGFRERLDIATNEICRRCVCSLNWKAAYLTGPGASDNARH